MYFAVILAPSIRTSFEVSNRSLLQLSKINTNNCRQSLHLFSVIEYLIKFSGAVFYRKFRREESIHRFRSEPAVAVFFITCSRPINSNGLQLCHWTRLQCYGCWNSSSKNIYHCWWRTFFNNVVLIFENWVDEERNLNMQTNEKCWLLSVFLALTKFKMC